MPFPRSIPFRASCQSQGPLRASRARPQSWRGSGRRGYSSEGPGASQSSKKQSKIDPTWLAGSIAVTLPSTYLLYNSGPHYNPFVHPLPGDNYHGEHGDEDHEEGEEGEEGEGEGGGEGAEGEESGGEGESDGDDSGGNKDEGADSGYESDGDEDKQENPDKPKPEGETSPDQDQSAEEKDAASQANRGVQALEKGERGQNRMLIADAKGGTKRRIESEKGISLGRADGVAESGKSVGDVKDGSKSAAAGQTSKQQKGVSNTDTKHSVDVMADPGKSKKSEGVPETAKIQGTVDPSRKQV